ncbi:MAG: hypothetical protein WD737_01670 [Gemmatimonadota bacterium]
MDERIEVPGEERRTVEDDYPLKDTAAALNDRLGLYLSTEQQRGLATGLLVGAALGAALLAWNLTAALRRD